jgi:enoyl-CoA hydratase
MSDLPKADYDDVKLEVRGPIGIVTLDRPQTRNALTFQMYDRLAEICAGISSEGDIRSLVVTGAGGRAFAAGTDISQFQDFGSVEKALAYEQRMEQVLGTIERCRVPIIAAIAGACTGGGAAIALACDIRLAARDMQFGVPIARTLGNCLSSRNLERLARVIGAGRTMELMLTARLMGAEEARAAGLVSEVLDAHPGVLARAVELANTLAGHAPLTMRATKEALRRLRDDGTAARDEDLIEMCYTSADFREGLESFLVKRKPVWTGR